MDDNHITYLAETDFRNERKKFGIKEKDRLRHTYVIGKTGMGKSTLLENMAIQDIQNGQGLAFIDPHGSTAAKLLDYIPEHRIDDVVYFAPFDTDHPIAFNLLEDVGPARRHFVASGLMSAFKKIWVDAWSARMEYILTQTILALLEYPNSTLLGINRMLSDKEFRNEVVKNIKDPSVRSFWIDEFGKYTERFAQEATPAIQNKVGQYSTNPLIRNIIGQPKSSFDLREIMDKRKIFIANLSKGLVGETNTALLGSMLTTRIYLAAMSRADVPEATRERLPNFNLYIDEFQSFANASFADILSEARKYKLSLTMAHQYIEQMPEEVQAAVFGNVGTLITFRVGATDAEVFEKEFAPKFLAEDLVNLGFAQIYLRLMIDGIGSQPFSAKTLNRIPEPARSFREEVIARSREQFAKPKQEVEEAIALWHEPVKKAPVAPRPPISQAVSREHLPKEAPVPLSPPVTRRVEIAPQAPRPQQSHQRRQDNQPSFPNQKQEKKKNPQTISLKETVLKEQKREPSKNLEELRKLLGQIKPDTKEEKSPRESVRPALAEDRKHDTNEIPEPELRKMLEVSDSE